MYARVQEFHLSPRHQPSPGFGFVFTSAEEPHLPHAAGDRRPSWRQQLTRACPLLLLLLLRGLLSRKMETQSPPDNQKAKQLLDRGEGVCVTLASSPRAAAIKQPHTSPTCFTWGLWPNSSIMCRSNEAKLVSKSHGVKEPWCQRTTMSKLCLAQGSASDRCPHTGHTSCQVIFQAKQCF